jgi:hypothetical protein
MLLTRLNTLATLMLLCGVLAAAPVPEKKEEPKKDAPTFTAIVQDGAGHITVRQSGKENVACNGGESRVENGVLYLTGAGNFEIDVKELVRVEITGACDFEAKDLKGKRLETILSGAGSLTLSGEVEEQVVTLSGAGHCRAEALKVKKAVVTLSGAGDVVVQPTDSLQADISGAGTIEYVGTPKDIQQNVTGAGEVRQHTGDSK